MVLGSWLVPGLLFGGLAVAFVVIVGGMAMSERLKIALAVVGVIVTFLVLSALIFAQYGNATIRIPL